jgi:hypothetical protein
MSKISMDKPAGKKPVPLFLMGNSRWIKYKIVLQFLIIKSPKGYKYGNYDDDNGYRQLHKIF